MKRIIKSFLFLVITFLTASCYSASYLNVYVANNLSKPIGISYHAKGPGNEPNWHPELESIAPGQTEQIMQIPTQPGKLKRKTWHFMAMMTIPGVHYPATLDIKIDKNLNASVSIPGKSNVAEAQGYVSLRKISRRSTKLLGLKRSKGGYANIFLSTQPAQGQNLHFSIDEIMSRLRAKL